MVWIALLPHLIHPPSNSNNPSAASFAPPVSPEATDAHALSWTIAHWALQYTPHVCWQAACAQPLLSAQAFPHVLMEVSACLRLWGGLDAMRQRLDTQNVGVAAHAWGPTASVAQARLWLGDGRREPVVLDDLPLTALAAAHPHLKTLHPMGCTCWGHLAALPRGGITRRFGRELLAALDQAYGRQPSIHTWLQPAEQFAVQHELHAQVELAEGLLQVASYQLQLLQAWLRSRHWGVLQLKFVWLLDIRRHAPKQGELLLETAQPTQDMAHVQRLLTEQLARTELPAPAHSLALHCLRAEPLPHTSISLLPQEQRSGMPLHQFLERVASKLGQMAVRRPIQREDHRPEAAQAWIQALPSGASVEATRSIGGSAHKGSQQSKPGLASDALRPAWLLKQALPLLVRHDKPYYQGPLTLMHGPERIEVCELVDAATLANTEPELDTTRVGAVVRDYFVAWSGHAGLLWIYRERACAEPGWFLHGIFA